MRCTRAVLGSHLCPTTWLALIVVVAIDAGGWSPARASGSPPHNPLWVTAYDGGGLDSACCVAISPDGTRVYVTGGSIGPPTVAYDATTGAQLWTAPFDGTFVTALAVDPGGGRIYLTGSRTAAYDAAGTLLWEDGFGENLDEGGSALTVSPDGSRLLVTGSRDFAGGLDMVTIAYDAATGRRLWIAQYDGPGHGYDFGADIGLSPDGTRVYVTGESEGIAEFNDDFATIAYDANRGAKLWVARLGARTGDDLPTNLLVSPDGRSVFVTGSSAGTGGYTDYATVRYGSSTGRPVWVARYDGPGHLYDDPHDAGISADGRLLFVTGTSWGNSSTSDYATIAYDTVTGSPRWLARYHGPAPSWDGAWGLAVNPDGRHVYVTGISTGQDGDYATVAYQAASGVHEWTERYDGPQGGVDWAFDVAVDPAGGRVIVTGYSLQREGSDGFDYATIAYPG